ALNTTWSNSRTIWPGPKEPRLPPSRLDGQEEFSLATWAKSAPASMAAFSSLHLASLETRMWRAVARAVGVTSDWKGTKPSAWRACLAGRRGSGHAGAGLRSIGHGPVEQRIELRQRAGRHPFQVAGTGLARVAGAVAQQRAYRGLDLLAGPRLVFQQAPGDQLQ